MGKLVVDLSKPPTLQYSTKCIVYKTQSSSGSGFHYTIVDFNGGGITCTCPGWQHRGQCRHVQSLNACQCGLPVDHEKVGVSHLDHSDDPFEGLPNE